MKIVEDNQEFSNMLSALLREEGFETEWLLKNKFSGGFLCLTGTE